MDLSYILSRTERGTQELQTRSGHVTHRQRAILLLVNGERCAADILAQLSSAGPDIDDRAEDLARLIADLQCGLVTQFDRRGADPRGGLGGRPRLLHFLLPIAGLLRVGCRSARQARCA